LTSPLLIAVSATESAALVVDRLDRAVLALDQVELGNEVKPVGRQGHRARMDAVLLGDLFGLGQCPGGAVDPAMDAAPLDGVGILEFVDHPRRQVRLIRSQRRGR
jgi:hypothetical protein